MVSILMERVTMGSAPLTVVLTTHLSQDQMLGRVTIEMLLSSGMNYLVYWSILSSYNTTNSIELPVVYSMGLELVTNILPYFHVLSSSASALILANGRGK